MLVLLVTGQQGSRTQPYTDGRGCHAAVSNFLKEAHLHAHHPHQGLDLTCVGKCSLLMSPGSLEWQLAVVFFFFFFYKECVFGVLILMIEENDGKKIPLKLTCKLSV